MTQTLTQPITNQIITDEMNKSMEMLKKIQSINIRIEDWNPIPEPMKG